MSKNEHTNCPIAKTAQLLSDTWTMLVIRDLLGGSMRFSELQDSLGSISSRTLILKLKKLEEESVVLKDGLYYALTPKGKKLKKIIDAMETWGKTI